jgi:DNA-binding MurR/RpiR family transcriptional regulator
MAAMKLYASFAELRLVPGLIRQGEIDLPMGQRSFRALCRMADEPQLVALNNINTLAEVLDVSPASVSRIARMLGFGGFVQFQGLFKRHLTEPRNFYSEQANKLVSDIGKGNEALLQTLAKEASENIASSLAGIDAGAMSRASNWLATSARVHVVGYRQSAALASIMSYGLGMIRSQVQWIGSHGHGFSVGLSQVNRNDVVVLLGSAPYSRETILAARLSRQQRARLLAVTDTQLSPLAEWSDIAITAPTESQFYSNSFCAMVFLVESLLTLTARELGGSALRNLAQREAFIAALNDEY